MKTKKRLLSIMLTLALVLGLMPGMSLTAFANGHTHNFNYSASGDTITATCQNDGCNLTDNKVTLRIVATTNLYANDGLSKEASLEGLQEYNDATGFNLSTDNIIYRKGDSSFSTEKIKNGTAGVSSSYEARIAYNGTDNFGNKVAKVKFALTSKPAPHTHIFTYTENGNVITANCTQNAANMEACDLTNKQAILTLNAPLHTTYGDGKDANATLTGVIPGVTNPTIHYSKGSVTLSDAPMDAGTYTAWCQLGSATASVEYTIGKATNTGWTTLPQAINNLVYTGQPKDLITAGVPSAGSALYTVGTDPDNEPDDTAGGRPYTSSVPEMTNAGTYYVWCKIDGGKNYTSINAQKVEVTIARADITPSVSIVGWTYGQTANTPMVGDTGNPGNGEVTYTYKVKDADDSTYKSTVPTAAGNYTVKAVIAETANYNSGVATKDFTISKANSTVTKAPEAKTLTYNGQAQELINAGSTDDGTMWYAIGENATTAPEFDGDSQSTDKKWNTSIPKATNVETYYVWYIVKGDENHHDSDPACVTVTISEKPSGGGGTADAVQQVVDKINALPAPDQVTLNDEKLIKEAREAYDKLTDTQKQDSRLTQAIKNKLGDCETALEKAKKADEAQKAASEVSGMIEALPDADKVTTADKAAIESARQAYDSLTDDQKKNVSEDTLKKLTDAETALAEAQVKSVKTVTVNAGKINAKTVNKAVAKAGGSSKYVKTFVIGKNAKKISKGAFKNYKNAKTLVVKTRTLKKSTVKNSLKGSKIAKVKVKVGNKKTNKKYVKKYKTIFTKKNAGRKVKVSL